MKLEPRPAIQATLILVLWGGLIWLIIILPKQVIVAVFATVFLPVVVGALWWLMYTIFRDRDRLKSKVLLSRVRTTLVSVVIKLTNV